MNKPMVIRQHAIVILPDTLLFLVGTSLFLETAEISRRLPQFQASALNAACEILGFLLLLIGAVHFLCWLGFRVEITFQTLVIRRCFFYRKIFSLMRPDITLGISQTAFDAWFDKGTLVIYAPGGDVITLNNLANFSQMIAPLSQITTAHPR